VKNKHLGLFLGTIITSLLILLSCKKINESSEIGAGLIPPVDNITTFDTVLDVEAFTDTFSLATDSSYSINTFDHYLGVITNDPFFGKTDAQILLELKPSSYRYTFANKPDSLFIDSVVMVLDYLGTHGDTLTPQTVNVYELGGTIDDFRADSLYKFREALAVPKLGLLGSRTFIPATLNDSVKAYQDTTVNQLRIRLDDSFGQRLLGYDTTGSTGAYTSDSNFRVAFKGFSLEAVSGNALIGVDLKGENTKLAIYYKYYKNGPSNLDTAVDYFTHTALSASQNYVKRDYAGTPLEMASGGSTPDPYIYIQNTPGTFANIKIPGLAGIGNRIVHRAELIMEEAFDISDSTFPPPPLLYLDAFDAGIGKYRTVPYDLVYDFQSFSANVGSFGGAPFRAPDPGGRSVYTWHFNLSRYVQHLLNGTETLHTLRVYAPVYTINQFGGTGTNEGTPVNIRVNSTANLTGTPIVGRVRVFGGDPTHTNPQRMRLRIVYSKI
jgi:hypothetical protein